MSSETLTESPPAAPVNPADPYERRQQTFPTLTDEQVERAAEFGVVQALPRGTVLFDRGDRTVDFFIILEGSGVDPSYGGRSSPPPCAAALMLKV